MKKTQQEVVSMLSCAITGRRPTRFKWKYKEENTGCKRLKKRLRDQFVLLYRQGVRRFYAGGALAVYDNVRSIRSGTGMTVHYAGKKRILIMLIHPDTSVVSKLERQTPQGD